jgi:putative ABC transport system permease protein
VGRFLWSQLLHRRRRTVTLAAGILVAAVSFTLLTSAARTSELRVTGTVEQSFRTAYDILVRPAGSFTQIERERGLVQENYLSGIFGGITLEQYRLIKSIPGIEVAAPIANLGYVLPANQIPIRLDRYLNGDPAQIYRVGLRWVASNGTSSYPSSKLFVYYSRQHRFVAPPTGGFGTLRAIQEVVPGREPVTVCPGGFVEGLPRPMKTPYSGPDPASTYLQCFSEQSPQLGRFNIEPFREGLGTVADARFPVLLAAIDPVQEARLLGLDDAVTSGRYLSDADQARASEDVAIPVLASLRTYVDQRLEVTVERLDVSGGAVFPDVLASADAFEFVTSRPGRVVGREVFHPGSMYEAMLDRFEGDRPKYVIDEFWTASPVRYATASLEHLTALQVRNPDSVWENPNHEPFFPAPPGSEDVQFRQLTGHPSPCPADLGGCVVAAGVTVVGRFDPNLLPGFSSLSELPLESYYPPRAEPADAASQEALGGRALLPSMNLGDYVSQPPFMFTTLKAAEVFLRSRYFEGSDASAPISAIRVRVSGVTGSDPLSRERIRRAAQLVHEQTGLAVDVTAGSSPHPMLIDLPAGEYGRPPLTVREGWVEKGVAVEFVDAIDRKSVALFGLILVICGFFLANGTFASVRSRRNEIGTLLCLGWSQGAIFRVVLGEVALVGLVAGILGAGLAAVLVRVFSLQMPVERTLLAVPIAVVLAVAAGLIPAWRASRSAPMDAVLPVASDRGLRGPVRRVVGVAVANLARVPSRTALGAIGLGIGVAALTILVALNYAFQGALVGTLLGSAVSVQVRGVDLASIAFTIALGGLSVADVLFLNVRERAPELVTLRAVGWSEAHLRQLVLLEGIAVGALGCVAGALLGAGVASLVRGVPLWTIAAAAAASAAVGVAVAGLASLVPLAVVDRLTPPTVLAEE